jgi:hypothetical protein
MNIQIEKLTPEYLDQIYGTEKTFIIEKKIHARLPKVTIGCREEGVKARECQCYLDNGSPAESSIQHSEREFCRLTPQNSFLSMPFCSGKVQKLTSPNADSTDVWDFLEIGEVEHD